MHLKFFLILISTIFLTNLTAQSKPAYVLFNSDGKKVKWKELEKIADRSDIILFGEYHNNPISHWLQLELAMFLSEGKRELILGAEMFEADNQDALNKYLTGDIDQFGLDTLARLWNNYKTDYKPITDLAKMKNLKFIATNAPRRYASMVAKNGFESLDELSEEEKAWIAPLPVAYDPELPAYKNMLTMFGDHASPNFPKAQALKDATMAHFILENFVYGSVFLHLNGAYHSDNYEGILWYLKNRNPNLKYLTITTVTQEDVHKLQEEHRGRADFIICVDEHMTKTF